LASDKFQLNPVAEVSPIPVTISSIIIDDQEITPDRFQYSFGLNLKGEEGIPGTFNIPIKINYSDGTSNYSAFTFDYQPQNEN